MRSATGPVWDLWTSGMYVGQNGRSHCRVTVEIGWELQGTVGLIPSGLDACKLPVRYFQKADGSQVETEIPYIKSVDTNDSSDTNASTCTIVIYNTKLSPANPFDLGNPGWFSFSRGANTLATERWGHTPNQWADVLVPNALLRTYQGFGGFEDNGSPMPIPDALEAGYLGQTGTWLVDTVTIQTNGTLTLNCRDMRKLLLDEIIYPPYVRKLSDGGVYPLSYARFKPNPVDAPAISYGTAISNKRIMTGIESNARGTGYWLVGDDGGVFTYGYNNFFGSYGGELVHEIVGIAITPTGNGYWIAGKQGNVFAFGDADSSLTGHAPASGQTIVAIECPTDVTSQGYYLCDSAGHVYALGAAVYHGGSPTLTHPVVAMACQPGGGGYWLVDNHGAVFAYGSAPYYGNATYAGSLVTAIATTPSGNGYYIVDEVGHVYAFGDAVYRGGTDSIILNDPICDLDANPNGQGYWLLAKDGGVFTFGNINFYGSLPGAASITIPLDGNYRDYSDIVKDLLRWAGFYLYDPMNPDPDVFGSIENTNAYAEDILGEDMFDKVTPMDAIIKIAEFVGYILWSDVDGGIHFESPNWWSLGNFLPDGTRTGEIPEIDERLQMVSYGMSTDDQTLRSQLIISTDEPTDDISGTITTILVPYDSVAGLKGIPKPAMWMNDTFIDTHEQSMMAHLLAVQIWFTLRKGSVTCAANPFIQINDQVRIWERQTDEVYIHYVSSKSTHHDLDTGEYSMTLTTHWLGTEDDWAINSIFPITHVPQPKSIAAVGTTVVTTPPPSMPEGRGPTGDHSHDPINVPGPIADLAFSLASVDGGTQVTLSWTPVPSNGVVVWHNGTDEANIIALVVETNPTTFVDPTPRGPGTSYYYVSAYNASGHGAPDPVKVIIP